MKIRYHSKSKVGLLLTTFMLIATIGFGQISKATGSIFSLSLKAGLNVSKINTDAGNLNSIINESLTTQQGYVFGGSARLGRSFFIQPEVLVSQKGGTITTISGVLAGKTFDMKYTTIDVPVLLGYKMGHFYVLAGPLFSNKISENDQLSSAISSVYANWSAGNGLANSTVSYQAGAGLNLLGLTLDVRYEAGLSNIINIANLPSGLNLSQKPSLFQVTLGFKLL